LIDVAEGDRVRALIDCDERRRRWYENTVEHWPEYAHERTQRAASVKELGVRLGLGLTAEASRDGSVDVRWELDSAPRALGHPRAAG
jgi:hypothetical protein